MLPMMHMGMNAHRFHEFKPSGDVLVASIAHDHTISGASTMAKAA
jgi:hypothetical protein